MWIAMLALMYLGVKSLIVRLDLFKVGIVMAVIFIYL